ncbi:hypothetical protein BGX28_003168 [Mortierella sp. GBA30]|nr:hypothetical protein BGX28_003168 [Mortierella sp. GBA30]
MSTAATNNAATLSRRPSIHSSSRPSSSSSTAPPRRFSTFEIEVEYISTNHLPIGASASNRSSLNNLAAAAGAVIEPIKVDENHAALNSVLEEEEDDEKDQTRENRATTPQQLPQSHASTPRSTRPLSSTFPRPRTSLRPQSQQQYPTQTWHHLEPDDQFARVYQPSNDPAPQRPTVHSLVTRQGGASRHSVGEYHVQASISRSDFLQSSHVQHDSTPVLSSTGSQSDEDEDEVHSPVDCLIIESEGESEHETQIEYEGKGNKTCASDNKGVTLDHVSEEAAATGSSQEHLPLSQDAQPAPEEIETQETLKRERTRILERTVVSSYREIDYKDISSIQPLKRGGYGEIHTAEWSRLRVVLKRALPEHSEGVEQFDQELEILKRVHDYDFIVPFYGVTTDPRTNVRCMVMKHCTNGNLCVFLEENHDNLTWLERYRLSIEITKGLEFLHKSGFHHRDLHSGNILLDDKRTAMICDFGLSRSSNKEQTSDLAATVGVASFLAPERFPQKRPIYSAECDIYSLGVIFWHISSGRIPFAKRLREPILLKELMDGHREEIVPGTPKEYRDMFVKCWDKKPSKRLKIDVVIAILQTLMAKPSEPVHQIATGFVVPSDATSAALPIPPEINSRMASLERASNALNKMVFDIQEDMMSETVNYIERTRQYFRDQRMPLEPYSPTNPPKTPIYLCPLVGDLAALSYYLTQGGPSYNPINESSAQTGDTALHLACLFLESPMDTIRILVELGADINLENLQGYTPVMILVSSNTQYCYEALRYFVMRGARIPAYIRNPITPLNSAQIYALNLVNESRQIRAPDLDTDSSNTHGAGVGITAGYSRQDRRRARQQVSLQNQHVYQERSGHKVERILAQGRPLIHVVAAMQEDYRILDCLCEAGLDPAISFGGETALVAAAAHLRIKNVEWLLNHDLDVSTEAAVQRAIKVVKLLHHYPFSTTHPYAGLGNGSSSGHGKSLSASSASKRQSNLNLTLHMPREFPDDIRDLGKFSWAGVAYGEADRMSKDMVGPVLNLLEQWTGSRRIANRKEVATKLKVMYGSSMDKFAAQNNNGQGNSGPTNASSTSVASSNSLSSSSSKGSQGSQANQQPRQDHHRHSRQLPQSQSPSTRGALVHGTRSLRKSQRHLVDQVLSEKPSLWFR